MYSSAFWEKEVSMYFPICSVSSISKISSTSSSKLWVLGLMTSCKELSFLKRFFIKAINYFSFWLQFSALVSLDYFSNTAKPSLTFSAVSPKVSTKDIDFLIGLISIKYFEMLLMILRKSSYPRIILNFCYESTIKILPFFNVFNSLTVPILFVMSISTPRLSPSPGVSIVKIV